MDTIFDVLFATPAFTHTLLAHDDLAPLDRLARLPNHSIRFATLGLLDNALRDASPFHALHTSSTSLSAPVLRVLLAWVLRHAHTPSALEHNVFVCCDAARSAAAQAVVEAGLAHWARTAHHRHPYQHLQVFMPLPMTLF